MILFFFFPPCNMCVPWAVILPFSTVCTTCYYANKTQSLVIRHMTIIVVGVGYVHDCQKKRSKVNLVRIWIKASYVRYFAIILSCLANPCCLHIVSINRRLLSPFPLLYPALPCITIILTRIHHIHISGSSTYNDSWFIKW